MPKLIPTVFTAYEFTEREQLEATVFSELQLKFLLTLRAEAAQEKNNIALDPAAVSAYLQDEAYYRGKIDLLSYLLEAHDASMEVSLFNDNSEE